MKKASLIPLIVIGAVVALYFLFKSKGSGSGLITLTGVGTLPTSALTPLSLLPFPGIGPLLSPSAPINNQTSQNTAPPAIPDPSLLAFTIPSIASTPAPPIETTEGDPVSGAYTRTPAILDAPAAATPPGVFYD